MPERFWVALTVRRDRHHQEAVTLWQQRDEPLLTTNHILGEVWTFLRRRDSHAVKKAMECRLSPLYRRRAATPSPHTS